MHRSINSTRARRPGWWRKIPFEAIGTKGNALLVPLLDLLPLWLEVAANSAVSLLLQLTVAQTSAPGNFGRGVLTGHLH